MDTTVRQLVDGAAARIHHLSPIRVEAHLLARDAVLLDVREAEELDEHGWIAGALHVPRGLLEFRADPTGPMHEPELDPRRLAIAYCAAGHRSALAAASLAALGYRHAAHLDGGIAAWKRAGLPVAGLHDWHRTDGGHRRGDRHISRGRNAP